MKRIINKPIRDQRGQVFLLVLIFLALGGIMLAPLLSYMSTGLKAGGANEERMEQLYAADAGVESALHEIMIKPDDLPDEVGEVLPLDALVVNGKSVNPIIITYEDDITFKVNATATDPSTSHSTDIESYVQILSFANFMDNVITSKGDVDVSPGSEVTGEVQLNGELDNKGTINDPDGVISEELIVGWPLISALETYYSLELEDAGWYDIPFDTIDLKFDDEIPGGYRDGDLTIQNTGSPDADGTLQGVVYVDGDVSFRQSGNKDYDIYLDGWTLFATGDIDFPSDRCTIHGPGCIVAIGNVNFQPKTASVDDPTAQDLIFVMSVTGIVNFQPNGTFYGSVAGEVEINLQPNCTLTWNGPPPTLKFPGAEPSEHNVVNAIHTWDISLQ